MLYCFRYAEATPVVSLVNVYDVADNTADTTAGPAAYEVAATDGAAYEDAQTIMLVNTGYC